MSQAQNTTKKTTGRYSVGEKLLVVAQVINIPGRNGNPAAMQTSTSMMSYWQKNEYGASHRRFEFLELEVIEHHKVSSEYDEKDLKDCDGYILKSADGRIFHNQYPRASYGQVSDRANYIFTEALPESDWEAAFENERKKGKPVQSVQFVLAGNLADDSSMSRKDKQKYLNQVNEKIEDYNVPAIAFLDGLHRDLIRELNTHKDYGNKWKFKRTVLYKGISNHSGKPFEITRMEAIPRSVVLN